MELNNYFNMLEKSIFNNISNPIWESDFIPLNLDIDFLANYGTKEASPLVELFANQVVMYYQVLPQYIYNKYKTVIEDYYKLLKLDYDPIQNYDAHETETISNSKDDTLTENGKEKNTATFSGSENVVENNTNTNTNTNIDTSLASDNYTNSFGYDSNEPQKTNSENAKTTTENSSQTNENNQTTKNFVDRVDTNLKEFENRSTINVSRETIERTLTRSGNIGVTTSQQMIESSINLDEKLKFIQFVFDLFQKELTNPIWL